VKTQAAESARKAFDEHFYAVSYHLRRAESAEQEASSQLYDIPWSISSKTGDLWLISVGPDGSSRHFDAEGVVANGDIAVREDTSAIDATLGLVNRALGLGLEPTRVKWARSLDDNKMYRALVGKYGKEASLVSDPLGEVFNSIGYELLSGYRNWVTHRGAPVVMTPRDLSLGIPLPDNVRSITDAQRLEFEMRPFLYDLVSRSVKVRCWPFVPPVGLVYSASISEASKDLELPGIRIGKGARGIEIRDARVAFGNLNDDALAYRSNNPHTLEENRVEFAGEMLAEYTVADYLHGIQMVVRFAERALSGKLDEGLRTLLERART